METPGSGPANSHCDACHRPVSTDALYLHHERRLCDDCYMDVRMHRTRKTHWQYIGSIKGDYLRPSPVSKK